MIGSGMSSLAIALMK